MKIVIDAMGGDNAPSAIIEGAVKGLQGCKADVVLVGKESVIETELAKYEGIDRSRISIIDADEVIDNNESPVFALRRKKNSSIVKALEAVKGNSNAALISAGSTGAVLAGGLLLCGRLEGIDRPALAAALPGKNGVTLLLDSGANVDSEVKDLIGFALVGSAYMEAVYGNQRPSVGLINNGAEEKKGNSLTKAAHQELKNHSELNFIGNVEPRYVYDNQADVLVCDGFAGNAILKASEGMGKYILGSLKETISSSFMAKIGYLFMRNSFTSLKKKFNYEDLGGAPLLGVDANIIKIHGSSKASAVMYAMQQAEKMIEGEVVSKIKRNLQSIMAEQNNNENNTTGVTE